MAARTKVTPKRRRQFLELLGEGHSVKHAAAAIHISRQEMYRQRESDAAFAAAWDAAVDEGTDVLEQEARRRAVEGVAQPIYHLGKIVGTVHEYSDALLKFLLQARRPAQYRQQIQHQHSGTVTHRHTHDLSRLSDGELAQLEQLVAAATVDARRN